jgi:hypothetical protein
LVAVLLALERVRTLRAVLVAVLVVLYQAQRFLRPESFIQPLLALVPLQHTQVLPLMVTTLVWVATYLTAAVLLLETVAIQPPLSLDKVTRVVHLALHMVALTYTPIRVAAVLVLQVATVILTQAPARVVRVLPHQ